MCVSVFLNEQVQEEEQKQEQNSLIDGQAISG